MVWSEWAWGVSSARLWEHSEVAATRAGLFLPCRVASKHPHTLPKWSLGAPAFLSVIMALQAAKGACLLCSGAQDWDTQSLVQPTHFPGFLFLLVPFLGCHRHLILFFSHPTWLHGNLSCSLGCIGVLLPVSSFPWDLVYTWMCFQCVCGGRWAPHPLTRPSWWLVWY